MRRAVSEGRIAVKNAYLTGLDNDDPVHKGLVVNRIRFNKEVMIVLRDTIEIKALPEQVFDFFLHLKENYHAWHPDHVDCRYLTPPPLKGGSVIHIEEYLHGELHKFKMRITKIEPDSRIEYEVQFGTKGAFIIEPQAAITSLFTAEIHIGTGIPLLGTLLDRLLRKFLSRELEGMKRHMSEEGQSLKRILEARTQ